MTQLELLSTGVARFYMDMQRYPTAEEGLRVLLERPQGPGSDKWEGPYLEKDFIPKDGWEREFIYEPGENGRFIVKSLGADGTIGGEGENRDLDNRST